MRLIKLPPELYARAKASELEYTTALLLGNVGDEEERAALLEETLREDLSVNALRQKIREQDPITPAASLYKKQIRNLSGLLRTSPALKNDDVRRRVDGLLEEILGMLSVD